MNLSEIRDEVRLVTVVDASNATDVELNNIVNQGLHEISAMFPWVWLETKTDLTPVADTRVIDLPDNFDYAIALVDDDYDNAVEYLASVQFFRLVGNDTGNEGTTLNFWTIFDGNIYVSPYPSETDAGRLTLYYYGQVSDLAYDTDEPPFHDGFHLVLVEYVKWRMWEREEYFEEAQRSLGNYFRYIDQMKRFYGSPVKHSPFLWGDGIRSRRQDTNITELNI